MSLERMQIVVPQALLVRSAPIGSSLVPRLIPDGLVRYRWIADAQLRLN